jgi:putative copper export protein
MDPVALILRWAHILPAVTLAGGLLYQWLQASSVDEDDDRLEASRRRWSKIVMVCALFLLVSGLVNTFRAATSFALPMHYNIALLVKMLLAFGVFYLSSVLAGRSATAKKFQADRKKWLKIAGMMVLAIVLLGSVMKVSDHPPKADDDEEDETSMVMSVPS